MRVSIEGAPDLAFPWHGLPVTLSVRLSYILWYTEQVLRLVDN